MGNSLSVPEIVQIPGTDVTLRKSGLTQVAPDLVPEIDPGYVFRKQYVEQMAYAIKCNQNCMLVGDAGVGKSSLVEQIGAVVEHPVRRANLHGESDTTIFVGRDKPTEENGVRKMVYERGLLAEAMEEGYWLLLDEIDAALQPVLFVFQQVLEENGKLVLEDGKGTVVRKHPDFRIFATANTIGIASRNRLIYSGTMSRMNEATLDRFGCVIYVEPLESSLEEKAIRAKVPDLDEDFVKAIVRIAGETRKQLKDEKLSCTFSTRRCLQWARAMTQFHPMAAARMTVLNKLNAQDYKVVEGVVQRFFGSS